MQIKTVRILYKVLRFPSRSMSLFKQVLNPITGQNEWSTQNDDYDYHQEVACAGFGDMLHDWERNQKYFTALRKTITHMHVEGREAHVLDIGTGTGILAMMAVEAGADSVTACEAFLPMANCAEQILKANGMQEKVHLIKKRSTELQIGKDMKRRANLLVTEVLDTELIGEGAIGIYNHAHEELLTDDCICIPAKATCYAQVAESPLAAQWNTLKAVANLDGEVLLQTPQAVSKCKGEAGLHDLQLSQLPLDRFRPITEAIAVFEFDFNRKKPRELKRQRNLQAKSSCAGSTDFVFYWWDIKMDREGEILLSCAPFWAHPEFKKLSSEKSQESPLANVVPWRDHWMQAIYCIPKPLHLNASGEEFTLTCNHDEYSLWFDVSTKDNLERINAIPRHMCTCSLHISYSRTRIGQMNESQRNKRYLAYLERVIRKDSRVLSIGDGGLLGIAASKLGAAKVICLEPQPFSRRFMESIVEQNKLENVEFISSLESLREETEKLSTLTHIFAEPYFLTSILPWDNFYFGSLLSKIRDKLSQTVEISPHSARILAMPVEFLDLHKIRTPVGRCEGFDLSLFDKMVNASTKLAQAKVEAQPLWEYPCRALAQPQEVLNVVFRNFENVQANEGVIEIKNSGICNGIALWVDWNIDGSSSPKSIVSTGPTEPIVPGSFIKWNMFVRQGVHLIGKSQAVKSDRSNVGWNVVFDPDAGQINFSFIVTKETL